MTQTIDSVLQAALALTEKERAEVAYRLIRSLDGPEPSEDEQAAIDAAWAVEAEERLQEVEDGKAELIPAEEVFDELLKRKKR